MLLQVEQDLREYSPNTPWYPILYSPYARGWGFCCGCWPYQIGGSDVTELFDVSDLLGRLFNYTLLFGLPIYNYLSLA